MSQSQTLYCNAIVRVILISGKLDLHRRPVHIVFYDHQFKHVVVQYIQGMTRISLKLSIFDSVCKFNTWHFLTTISKTLRQILNICEKFSNTDKLLKVVLGFLFSYFLVPVFV